MRDTAHQCCRRQRNYGPQNERFHQVPSANSKTYGQYKLQEPNNPAMEPLRTIFAPSRCPLKMQLSSQFPQLGPKTKSAQTRSLRAQTSNHWTNALAISYANPRSQLMRVLAVTAYKYPHPKLWKRIRCHAGVHDFPHIFHLHNVTVTVITGRVANNIQRRPLVFLDHPCSFFVSKVMFQFPNNSRNEHFQRWRKSNQ